MKKLHKNKLIGIGILAVIILGLVVFAWNAEKRIAYNEFSGTFAYTKARVDKMTYDDTNTASKDKAQKQEFQVTILTGKHKGERYEMRNVLETVDVHRVLVREGDEILVNYSEDSSGKMNTIHLYEIVRDKYIYLLVGIFVLSMLIICGIKGAKSVLTLLFTGIMIIGVLMPIILAGYNPLISTVIVCISTAAAAIFFINGINNKTIVAIIGTLGGILIAALITTIIGNACRVTGLTSNDAQTIAYMHKSVALNFKLILFSAIIIGSLGAVMDVSISIASSMSELLEIKPDISKKELIKSGMNIGKDIMTTMANTLILAYVGGAFQLFLLILVEKVGFAQLMNIETIITEIITAISGSIGLIWTVPITVFAMANMRKYEIKKDTVVFKKKK